MVTQIYVKGMKDKEHQKHPGAWASEVARQYKGVEPRDLVKYINKLVDKGKLPKELKAEYEVREVFSFKEFTQAIQEVKQDKDVHAKKFKQMFGEKLSDSATQKDYIDDFEKSDAPQLQGKSKEKRREMAIAAYLSKNEDYTHYPAQVKKDNLPADGWITGDPTQPIEFDGSDAKSILDKANKSVEKERGIKQKPFVESAKLNGWGEITEKDDKSGKELNNPTKGDTKKYKVYVRNDKGNVVKVEFGDPNMEIKRDDPERRKAFRARHNCDQKKDKTTAGYWSCKFWSGKSVTDLMKG